MVHILTLRVRCFIPRVLYVLNVDAIEKEREKKQLQCENRKMQQYHVIRGSTSFWIRRVTVTGFILLICSWNIPGFKNVHVKSWGWNCGLLKIVGSRLFLFVLCFLSSQKYLNGIYIIYIWSTSDLQSWKRVWLFHPFSSLLYIKQFIHQFF